MFKKLALVGIGLIGSSIARAARAHGLAQTIAITTRRPETLAEAEALGLGDVHIMFGIGAIIGAAGTVLVFFVAPFVGVAFAIYKFLFRRGREVPYGPFLSIATLIIMLFYCRLYEGYLSRIGTDMMLILQHKLTGA